ncbi:MAG: glycoside hydrolase family 127 protein [Pirellulales bacterium]|nr:glycoside hydrolase family 127 protein [Pirellulales bacterium]
MKRPSKQSCSRPAPSRRQFLRASATTVGTLVVSSGLATSSLHGAAASSVKPRSIATPVFPREPLRKVPFAALPLGSVRARGWMLKQLELQRDGLTGRADALLPSLTRESSAWLARGVGDGEGWEKGPYYAKGLTSLAYTLQDPALVAKAEEWVEAILGSQREDGSYGPKNDDWWPRMVVNVMLRDYAEATGDDRVVPFLARYYAHMLKRLPKRPLREWGKARAGDDVDSVFWLYNRTGAESLLVLADLLNGQSYQWRTIFAENAFFNSSRPVADFYPKHSVNVAQALKAPAIYWQRSGDDADRAAYRQAIEHLTADHGTSFGINTGTEMVSGRSTVEGVELCAIVENMLSAETAMRILGDARIGDELELVAFNALPAAFSKDFRQHVYYTLANNVSARRGLVGYEVDYDDGRTPAARSGYPCCCYNLHMGWPKLVQNAWAATAAGGLALMTYVPSDATTRLPDGTVVRAVCETNYPFSETIAVAVQVDQPTKFPLSLRIPGWCRRPVVVVNGKPWPDVAGGQFAELDRVWTTGDRIEIQYPMQASFVPGVNGAVSVRRGPLVYSLRMDEKWTEIQTSPVAGFESYEVTSDTPWNYALEVDVDHPEEPLAFETRPFAENPFATGAAPVVLKARAKRVPEWQSRPDGLLSLDPPASPVASDQPTETIELAPFGSQMLRVTNFPVLGTPSPPPRQWSTDFENGDGEAWIVYRGGVVRKNRLHLPLGAKALATNTDFADVALQAIVGVGTEGDAGLVFRVTEPSLGFDDYKGYYAGIDAHHGVVLVGKSDYSWTPLARGPFNVAADRDYLLKVVVIGSRIELWIDDAPEPVLTCRDDSFTHGMAGVRSYANRASFRTLRAVEI